MVLQQQETFEPGTDFADRALHIFIASDVPIEARTAGREDYALAG